MHILITGANGQLGRALQAALPGSTLTLIDLPEVDITTPGTMADIIRQTRPDLVIHCAAYTDVDGCARDPERGWIFGEGIRVGRFAVDERGEVLWSKVESFWMYPG